MELVSSNVGKNDVFGVHIAIINETEWPYSGYTTSFGDQWTFIKNCEVESKLAQRMFEAITNVLLDTSHLLSVVRRDSRQRIGSLKVVAVSSNQQVNFISEFLLLPNSKFQPFLNPNLMLHYH